MRIYGIYKVKEEYEKFMRGREHLLNELLKDHIQNEKRRKEVHYLCDFIERNLIEDVVVSRLSEVFETVKLNDDYYELAHAVKGEIIIYFSPYTLIVQCNGSRMLDLDLFVSLSEIDRHFFAVMKGHDEWGWLKPIKYGKQRKNNRIVF